jgi:hypothetical protein
MPLHDWTARPGWEGMHLLWISELLRWVKPRLPDGYRAYLGTTPTMAIGSPSTRADLSVRQWSADAAVSAGGPNLSLANEEPDVEVAVATIDPGAALLVERVGRLVAAVELISPRNKDRPVARAAYVSRYVGYVLECVHLLLIDVHPRPIGFSFADQIAEELHFEQTPCPAPLAVSYRVGEPAATGGRILSIWRRPLSSGVVLPTLPLPLSLELKVSVDLEQTYTNAASDAYLP